jgi:hypothetical protein
MTTPPSMQISWAPAGADSRTPTASAVIPIPSADHRPGARRARGDLPMPEVYGPGPGAIPPRSGRPPPRAPTGRGSSLCAPLTRSRNRP